jgi:alpha-glucosidase
MRGIRAGWLATAAVVMLASGVAWGQAAGTAAAVGLTGLTTVEGATALPNGVDVTAGGAVLRVTALTDEIVRVRIGVGTLPEDASWAVVPEAHRASVTVEAVNSLSSVGFKTKALEVEIARNPLRIVVKDLKGNVISEDAVGKKTVLGVNNLANGTAGASGASEAAKAKYAVGDSSGGFVVWKAMPEDEHYFGLGDKPGPLDRRNEAFSLWNTDAFGWQESTDPLYKAIPWFMGFRQGRAYGVLLDNTWRTWFDFGKAERDAVGFGAEGGPLDYYVLGGPTPKDVMRQYTWLTGNAPLPPRWSFGYQQSRYSYYPESQVREIAARLRKDRIPADVIWLDIDYQDRNRPFTVDKTRFPDMGKLVKDMKAADFNVVPIADLHVAYTPGDASYMPYKTGAAGNEFVHNPDGSVYVGKVWPGPSVFPDFTRAQTRIWWGGQYKEFVELGFAGFWDDMNEPSVFDGPGKTMPLDTVHRIEEPGFVTRTATHAEIHNVFGMENSRGTWEGLTTLRPNERPFVMTRASYAGGQRYAVTWTGDNSATWNHLRQTTPQMENLGLSGFAFVGADAGGFASSPQPALLTKWLEISSFQPIDRDHSAKGTAPHEPWVNGPQAEAVIRKYIEWRYRLLPYIYTSAEETSRTGAPLLRPLFVEFPAAGSGGGPLDLDAGGEFLLGADLLVAPAPVPDALDDYTLTLPPGQWWDFWTGEKMPMAGSATALAREIEQSKDPKFAERPDIKARVAAAAKLTIKPEEDVLPVYVRGGAILPLEALTKSTAEVPKGPLELRVYMPASGDACRGSVYWDDGHTLDYKKGEYSRQAFGCAADGSGVTVTLGKREGSYAPWWKEFEVVVYGAEPGWTKATWNGRAVKATWDKAAGTVRVVVPASAEGGELRVGELKAGAK